MNMELIRSLYQLHRAGIYRFALSILKNPATAEDVLQETFARLLQQDHLPFEPGKETAWLYRVARNLCYDHLRNQKKEQPAEFELPVSDDYSYIELIASLTQTEQEILSLKILGNLTHEEIASVMRLTTHGAKKRYERAIRRLRSQMKEES